MAEVPGHAVCNGGVTLKVDTGFADAPQAEVLWTPGGRPDALKRLMNAPEGRMLAFLRQQSQSARYVASGCEGALLLAAAGLLDGYRVTTHWAFLPRLRQNVPKVEVVDGHPRFHLDRNRLTGGGISSGLDEALELVRLLRGEKIARSVQQTTPYYPDSPVTSEIPTAVGCPLDPASGQHCASASDHSTCCRLALACVVNAAR